MDSYVRPLIYKDIQGLCSSPIKSNACEQSKALNCPLAFFNINGEMVGITRMNVLEKMPKQLLLTNIHSLILIPNTDSYIFYLD